eukprot:3371249-Pleurochrysis_carterae.AAC.1
MASSPLKSNRLPSSARLMYISADMANARSVELEALVDGWSQPADFRQRDARYTARPARAGGGARGRHRPTTGKD